MSETEILHFSSLAARLDEYVRLKGGSTLAILGKLQGVPSFKGGGGGGGGYARFGKMIRAPGPPASTAGAGCLPGRIRQGQSRGRAGAEPGQSHG